MTERETEFVKRVEIPLGEADPGTSYGRVSLIGCRGAVSLSWMEPMPATPETDKINAEWMKDFGHPLWPLWADLGFHSVEPVEWIDDARDCDLILGGRCYYDGSSLNADELGQRWEATGRNFDWLFAELHEYYEETFHGAKSDLEHMEFRRSVDMLLKSMGGSDDVSE